MGAAVREDGTFKPRRRAARALRGRVLDGEPIIAYCRIGERSAHTWFVLHELLGQVRRQELRRLLDRMGQPRQRPDREGLSSTAWCTGGRVVYQSVNREMIGSPPSSARATSTRAASEPLPESTRAHDSAYGDARARRRAPSTGGRRCGRRAVEVEAHADHRPTALGR